MKAKLSSLNKELEEAKAAKSGRGVAELTTSPSATSGGGDVEVMAAEREGDASNPGEEIASRSPTQNKNVNHTKVVVLRQKLEGKDEEVKLLKRKLEEKEGLVQVLQENMTSLTSGDEEKFAIISQAIQKDEKIFRLSEKILEHDKVVMDLQENVKEKEEVIQSRNRAFKLIAEELNQNRVQLAEKDQLISQLSEEKNSIASGALEKDDGAKTNEEIVSLKSELQAKERALLQLNDRFAITKEQMNHLQ